MTDSETDRVYDELLLTLMRNGDRGAIPVSRTDQDLVLAANEPYRPIARTEADRTSIGKRQRPM